MHSVSIRDNQIYINHQVVTLPIPLEDLKAIFNATPVLHKAKYNTIYTWNEFGIHAYSKKGDVVEALAFQIQKIKSYAFLPAHVFQGQIELNNTPLAQFEIKKKKVDDNNAEWIAGSVHVYFGLADDDTVASVEFSTYTPEVVPEPDRYVLKPFEGEALSFTDLNFKLAVIQVLMYEKDLIKPAFDIFEFIKRYKAREIDADAEGYDVIPEALRYFEELSIDKKFAPEITEIYQDGGNDIYMNIIPFWSGESDDFTIRSFQDVDLFPNLKSMTLFYTPDIDSIKQSMLEKDIEINPL